MKTIMMAAALASTLAVGGSIVAAQNDASASSTAGSNQRSYDVDAFDKIVAVGPHHFVVTVGGAASVRAEGEAESLDKYRVEVEDGALKISPKREYWRERGWEELQVEPATFYITLPRLTGTVLAGSGDMRVDRIAGEDFAASLAGSGRLEIGALAVEDARLSIAGSGQFEATGTARRAQISIAGSGNLHAPGMTSDNARISIAGSGNASLTVNDDAQMSIVGSGNVEIAGNASCTLAGFGSGRARCREGVLDTRKQWGEWSHWDGPPAWANGDEWDEWGDWSDWDDGDD